MDDQQIDKIIIETASERDGRKILSCSAAFAISKEHDIALKAIGEACNRSSVKIVACQLRCFP